MLILLLGACGGFYDGTWLLTLLGNAEPAGQRWDYAGSVRTTGNGGVLFELGGTEYPAIIESGSLIGHVDRGEAYNGDTGCGSSWEWTDTIKADFDGTTQLSGSRTVVESSAYCEESNPERTTTYRLTGVRISGDPGAHARPLETNSSLDTGAIYD